MSNLQGKGVLQADDQFQALLQKIQEAEEGEEDWKEVNTQFQALCRMNMIKVSFSFFSTSRSFLISRS